MYDAFSEATRWGQLTEINYVNELNRKIIFDELDDVFLMQEALHEKKISDIAASYDADALRKGIVVRRGKKNYNKVILK